MPALSVVVPCYNEEACIPALLERLDVVLAPLDPDFEVVLVDDGSRDGTLRLLREASQNSPHHRYLSFSRNFGHEAASTAGLAAARGDAVVLIDADLQDPPELIAEMVQRWRDGFDVVTARRVSRRGETVLKKVTSHLFYRAMARFTRLDLPMDTGDFRLMSRAAVDAFVALPERNRFVRGMVVWVGFRTTEVPYERDARVAGETKYGALQLVALALDAMIGFTTMPLRLASLLGLGVTALALVAAMAVMVDRLVFSLDLPGYTLLASGMFLLGGVQLSMLGIIGEYVGRVYIEVQQRPLFIVAERSAEPTA